MTRKNTGTILCEVVVISFLFKYYVGVQNVPH